MSSILRNWREKVNTYEDILEIIQSNISLLLGYALIWRIVTLIIEVFNLTTLEVILFRNSPILRFSYYLYLLVFIGIYGGGMLYLNYTDYKFGWVKFGTVSIVTGILFFYYVNFLSLSLPALVNPDLETVNAIFHSAIIFAIVNLVILFVITFPFVDSKSGEGYTEPLSEDVPSYWKS